VQSGRTTAATVINTTTINTTKTNQQHVLTLITTTTIPTTPNSHFNNLNYQHQIPTSKLTKQINHANKLDYLTQLEIHKLLGLLLLMISKAMLLLRMI